MTHIAVEIAPGITRYIAQSDPEDAPRKVRKKPPEAYLPFLSEWRSVVEFTEHFDIKQSYASAKLNSLLDLGKIECEQRNKGSTRVKYYRKKQKSPGPIQSSLSSNNAAITTP